MRFTRTVNHDHWLDGLPVPQACESAPSGVAIPHRRAESKKRQLGPPAPPPQPLSVRHHGQSSPTGAPRAATTYWPTLPIPLACEPAPSGAAIPFRRTESCNNLLG